MSNEKLTAEEVLLKNLAIPYIVAWGNGGGDAIKNSMEEYSQQQTESMREELEQAENGLSIAIDGNEQLKKAYTTLKHQADDMASLLKWFAGCPYNIDEETIPNKGIESNEDQVVVTISISYVKWRQLQDMYQVLTNYKKEL